MWLTRKWDYQEVTEWSWLLIMTLTSHTLINRQWWIFLGGFIVAYGRYNKMHVGESVTPNKDFKKVWLPDRRRAKWSPLAAMPRRRYKNTMVIWHIHAMLSIYTVKYFLNRRYIKRKRKRSDSVLWQMPLHQQKDRKEEIWPSPMTKAPIPTEMSKGQSDNTNNATKKFD